MPAGAVNFVVVGCGKVGWKHLQAIADLGGPARLCGVCDTHAERKVRAAETFGVRAFSTVSELVENCLRPDVTVVAVPTGHHAEVVQAVAPFSSVILVEKPMALRLQDCDAMMRAARSAGAQLFVAYQNRYNPPVQAAWRAVKAGSLGKPVLATARVRWCRRPEYYETEAWRGTWELDGGVVAQQGSHHLDLLFHLFGPVAEVQCRAATRLLPIEVEDTAVAVLRFASGALGVFEATVAARPSDLEGSISLLGSRGTVIIGGFHANELRTWAFEDKESEPPAAPEDDGEKTSHSNRALLLEDVVRTVVDGAVSAFLCSAEQGRANVALIRAFYESAAQGGVSVQPGVLTAHSRLGERVV